MALDTTQAAALRRSGSGGCLATPEIFEPGCSTGSPPSGIAALDPGWLMTRGAVLGVGSSPSQRKTASGWLSSLEVTASDGTPQGSIVRRFGVARRRYDLLRPDGRLFARIQAPRWRVWTFPVEGADGVSRAEIAKKWSGTAREMFTDADTFRLQLEGVSWQLPERAVLLAAAILIDFFETTSRPALGAAPIVFD